MPDDYMSISNKTALQPGGKASQAFFALARMTLYVDEPADWKDARAMLRRLAREAMEAVAAEAEETTTAPSSTEAPMPEDRPGFYATHTITTEPLRLPEGAVVVVARNNPWKTDQTERNYLVSELAKRDDLIAHYKIGEAGWQEEAKGLEAKVRNLRANLDAAHRERAALEEQARDQVGTIGRMTTELGHAEEAIASLRAQLARGAAIEAKARAVVDSRFPIRGDAAEVCGLKFQALERALSPSPGPGAAEPGEEPKRRSIVESIAAIRAAGGSDWDKVSDVRAFLGRDEDEQAAKLDQVVAAAQSLIDSVPDWKPGDGLEAALIDGGPIIALACALANLRVADRPQPKEAL